MTVRELLEKNGLLSERIIELDTQINFLDKSASYIVLKMTDLTILEEDILLELIVGFINACDVHNCSFSFDIYEDMKSICLDNKHIR